MSIKSSLAKRKKKARINNMVRLCLVREKAGKGLSEIANGLGLRLVLAIACRARDAAEERGVAEGVEGIGQGLRLTGRWEERKKNGRRTRDLERGRKDGIKEE